MDKINKDIFSDRIKKVRNLMAKNNVDAYLIPMSDPHGSEMLDAHYHEISFLTGFTGSAGDVLITKDEGFLWTDSRYFLQAAENAEVVYTPISTARVLIVPALLYR